MKSLEQLDSWITARMRAWSSRVSGGSRSPEILEIRRDILNDIRDRIEPTGDGKNIFPYNTTAIDIAAETSERASLIQQAIGEDNELEQTIAALLSEAGCPVRGLHVIVRVSEDAALASSHRPFRIEYLNLKSPQANAVAKTRPKMKLIVVRGQADSAEYAFDADRVNIGRLKEVISDHEGLRRRNDVAFSETETTVSREHAYIRYDAEGDKFRLYDSMSQRGTSVFREGRRFQVPKGPTRGFQLSPGDEIHLGDARLRFETGIGTVR
jgi:FHA domain